MSSAQTETVKGRQSSKANLSCEANVERKALRLATKAILLRELNMATVASISMESAESNMGRVDYSLIQKEGTMKSLADQLLLLYSEVYGGSLCAEGTCVDASIWPLAKDLAERISDLFNPSWRDNQVYLVDYIQKSFLPRADVLVAHHEARIRGLAALLVQKGELKGADLVAFF